MKHVIKKIVVLTKEQEDRMSGRGLVVDQQISNLPLRHRQFESDRPLQLFEW
jgi:hypothetical protein